MTSVQVLRTAAIGLLGLLAPAMARACPLCKDAIQGDVASALSWTTVLLLSFPSVLVAIIGGWIFFLYWRAAREPAVERQDAAVEDRPAWTPLLTEKES